MKYLIIVAILLQSCLTVDPVEIKVPEEPIRLEHKIKDCDCKCGVA